MAIDLKDAHKYVSVYRAPALINWGHPKARLVYMVLREALSTVHERREVLRQGQGAELRR